MSFDKKLNHGEALFQAALTEFISHGYAAASLNQILSAAGMSKGQFYYHFGNKKGLYFALIDVMQTKKKSFLEQNSKIQDVSEDFFERFGKELEMTWLFTQEHPEIQRFSESLLKEKGNLIFEQAVAEKNIADDTLIQTLIVQAKQQGVFRQKLPLAFIQDMLGYLAIHVSEMFQLEQGYEFKLHLEPLLDFLRQGLGSSDFEKETLAPKPKKQAKNQDVKSEKSEKEDKKQIKKIKKEKPKAASIPELKVSKKDKKQDEPKKSKKPAKKQKK